HGDQAEAQIWLFADYELDWDHNNKDEALSKYLPPMLGSGDNVVKPKNHGRMNIVSHINITTNDSTQKTSIQKDSRIEMEKFIQELYLEPVSEETIEVISRSKEPDTQIRSENDKHVAIELAHLYQKARKAKKNTVHAKQEEILSWYYYAKGFEKRVDDILSICRNDKRADDLAIIQVYDEIWDCLSGISQLTKTQEKTPIPNKIYQPEASLRQYAIEHKMNPKEFSIITEAEKYK
ncbi:4471_t:CDS:2, partial [Acaulospora colombiana]